VQQRHTSIPNPQASTGTSIPSALVTSGGKFRFPQFEPSKHRVLDVHFDRGSVKGK
jgi:hypothetical protein